MGFCCSVGLLCLFNSNDEVAVCGPSISCEEKRALREKKVSLSHCGETAGMSNEKMDQEDVFCIYKSDDVIQRKQLIN